MGSVFVRVDGLVELGERYAQLSAKSQGSVARSTTYAGAQVIRKTAIVKAPISKANHRYYKGRGAEAEDIPPGNLKSNIILKFTGKKTGLDSEHIVTVRVHSAKGNAYAEGIFSEHGTVNEAPEPWLRPAFDQEKLNAVSAMKARFEQTITKKGA